MAKVLKGVRLRGRTPVTVYPWHEWFDGDARRLTRGEDFFCLAASFRQIVYEEALRRGGRAIVHVADDDTVDIQFVN